MKNFIRKTSDLKPNFRLTPHEILPLPNLWELVRGSLIDTINRTTPHKPIIVAHPDSPPAA